MRPAGRATGMAQGVVRELRVAARGEAVVARQEAAVARDERIEGESVLLNDGIGEPQESPIVSNFESLKSLIQWHFSIRVTLPFQKRSLTSRLNSPAPK
jgi:hypothetical protein